MLPSGGLGNTGSSNSAAIWGVVMVSYDRGDNQRIAVNMSGSAG